jgi:hypothetical protein
MKQSLKIFTPLAFCAVLFSNCSKHTGKQVTGSPAPALKKGLVLSSGQKIELEYTTKATNTMEMMGQQMEITADAILTRQIEVKEKKATSYLLTSTITKMTLNSSFMGQQMNYDSDKKEDADNEMGKAMKGQINVPKETEVDDNAKMINIKKDTAKKDTDSGNPLMSLIENMGAAQDESNGVSEAFQVLPANVKVGDSWSDSVIVDGSKTNRTYTVKSIEGNNATITLTGTQVVSKEVEAQGMAGNISLDSKLSGEVLVDTSTGIVKQRTLTMEGTGNVDAMGQAIPMTTKVITTSVVK